jgi:3-(3-hydroxy-phenyl)propionate hydroxylase
VREHAVLIVGGGPTGMMLAGELMLAGVDAAIVERRPTPELAGSRAGGFHSRTIEILDQRGIADRFLAEGQIAQTAWFGGTVLDVSDFPTRHPYGLGLWQRHIERIMAGWIDELGVRVYRGLEVTGFVQDNAGVDVYLADGSLMRADFLVGADGGRSIVRRGAGIGFAGAEATRSHLIAEVEMTEEPELGTRLDAVGVHALGRAEYEIHDGKVIYADHGPVGVMLTENHVGPATDPSLEELRAALVSVYGTDFGVHNPTSLSRFTDATRQAVAYRTGRVLLAGDAAHIHHPSGGQGIGLGLQDAVNLGWKLAEVVNCTASEVLLDTYHAERHPADARILAHTMAQSVLQQGDIRHLALRDTIDDLLSVDGARRKIAATIHGLDVHYDLGDGHPLLGRRMPDLDLATATGSVRVYSLLHRGQPTLLNLGGVDLNVAQWTDTVQLVDGQYSGTWELPALGAVPAPDVVLIRPDGHVAWVGEQSDAGLTDALTTWFGPPASI